MTYQYIAESTLPADTPTYVTREADSQLYQSLLEGKLCYVFNSRKIGKSSLALQTIERLGKKGVRSVFIDLSSDETKLEHPEQWYANILDTLAYELKLEVDLKSWLQERNWLSPLRRFREFIELVMLSQVSEKIVIFFDEIDSVLSLNFSADDLFAFIRSCYNRRTQNAEYNRITFCLLGVATPSDLIQDKKRTPFNIGQAIELKGFTKEQAAPLAKGLEGKVNDPIQVLNEILDWTGGQPFLTQKLCKIVLEKAETCNPDIAELVQSYIINNWEANDNPEHIGTIRDRILSNQQRTSQLLGIYQQIITPPNPPLLRGGTDSTDSPLLSRAKDSTNSPLAEDKKNNLTPPLTKGGLGGVAPLAEEKKTNLTPPLTKGGLGGVAADNSPDQMELQLSGLVVKRNGYLQVYNPIYAAIFNLDWVQQELAKLRPYQENFAAWIASNRQDTSRLLHGQALDDALQWKKGKRLSDEDNDFLDDSRDDERQKLRTSNKLLKEVRRQGMEVFKVEEAGRNALKLFHSGGKQIQALRIAIKAGKDLKKWIPDNPPPSEYPTITPLSALQIIIAKIRERRQFVGHNGKVNSVSFNPTGNAIATASDDKTAKLWNLQVNCLVTFTGHNNRVISVSFSPTGDSIATASFDGTAKLWDLQGNCLVTFTGHNYLLNSVSFSPKGDAIATASSDRTAKLWDLHGNCLVTFVGHNDSVTSVSFSPKGDAIATASSDGTAKLWDLHGNCLVTAGHNDLVWSVSFSPNGDAIATASDDKTAKLWDLQGNCLVIFTGHNDSVGGVSFSPKGDAIATASDDKTAKLWDLQSNCLVTFTAHNDSVTSVSFSPTGDAIATASDDKTAKLWDLQGNCLVTFTAHNHRVKSVSFSPTRDVIATASRDKTAKLWDLQGNCLVTFTGHNHWVNSVSFSPIGDAIATASTNGTAKLWDLQGNCLVTFTGHNHWVTSVSFSPTGDVIATASVDKTAKLWGLHGNCLVTFTRHNDSVNSVSFSPTGDVIATASSDKTAKLWDLQGNCLVTVTGHEDLVNSICFSPNGDAIATASHDKTAKLWDLEGNCLVTFTGHQNSVNSVSFSPTGDTIATASQDGTAKLWDLQGNLLADFSGYKGNLLKGEADFVELKSPIYSICFSRDGKFLITGSQDGKMRFWPVESLDELLASGREWLGEKI
ncbi:MAG: AAA-like domain-containing protein [Microcoleus sp. PH2017_25_DOB_D_A]|uniref:WD40 domain-containing protein n=1 Tax=unclassified Microcoleus TaxID=2642155 RepID=UPI001D9E5521|nr:MULTISPECIES: AAA-like domain-containing protein [unclassified Microcoleus]MCC3492786.1 AAA-like domain-containing protein [Microcoleus sp. PH2017_16_JOR_D_A]MCC3499013.1 AAA-like domain-containing protein [Microcoleus sp. PH2017_15_JOR_U_A]MCC3536819.1 AAA-like domain-containing protein [Microcoleus sp. PH2017_25_DOB_D_A]MCC3548962.1 AAA-like domain-containing protein [Microcoleus sp. PH2017_24_DOB_U_A]MCC3599518.1 AAA-like domain-containing protein [Microcoleus sp. PH2017_26_ELK_O_A]